MVLMCTVVRRCLLSCAVLLLIFFVKSFALRGYYTAAFNTAVNSNKFFSILFVRLYSKRITSPCVTKVDVPS